MSEDVQETADQPAPEQTYAEYPEGEYPAPEAPPSIMARLMARKLYVAIAVVIVVVVVVLAASMGGGGGGLFGGKAPPAPMKMVPLDGGYSLQGPQVPAGQTQDYPVEFNSTNSSEVTNVYEVDAACSWTDDLSGSEPDSMTFELVSPEGKNISQTSEGSSGNANLVLKSTNVTDKKMEDNTKGWTLRVTCNFAGHRDVGPFGFLINPDAGNNFAAKITYKYYGYEGKTNSTK